MREVVALIGLRGSGKSTVGRVLAARLGYVFADSDDEVAQRLGVPVDEMIRRGDIERFRAVEASVIAELLSRRNVVVATGGGCIENEHTRKLLTDVFTVWLTAPVPVLAERCSGTQRPPLTKQGGELEIAYLSSVRAPFYAECAKLTVITANRTPDEVCDIIEAALKKQ